MPKRAVLPTARSLTSGTPGQTAGRTAATRTARWLAYSDIPACMKKRVISKAKTANTNNRPITSANSASGPPR